jgi:hypothetical protein
MFVKLLGPCFKTGRVSDRYKCREPLLRFDIKHPTRSRIVETCTQEATVRLTPQMQEPTHAREDMSARQAVMTRGKRPVPTRSTARTDKSIRRLNQAFKGAHPGCDSSPWKMHRIPALSASVSNTERLPDTERRRHSAESHSYPADLPVYF